MVIDLSTHDFHELTINFQEEHILPHVVVKIPKKRSKYYNDYYIMNKEIRHEYYLKNKKSILARQRRYKERKRLSEI